MIESLENAGLVRISAAAFKQSIGFVAAIPTKKAMQQIDHGPKVTAFFDVDLEEVAQVVERRAGPAKVALLRRGSGRSGRLLASGDVEIDPDTKLAEILGARHAVKSHHHQGLDSVGEGLRASAHAEDGSIEGIEDPRQRFALGVLWHPEAGDDMKLFEALVEQAREYKQARAA